MTQSAPIKVRAALSQFESARANLETFEKENARVVEDYDMMREAYNSALTNIKAVYKDNYAVIGAKYGEFSARTKVSIDARKLMKILGDDDAAPYVELRYVVLKAVYDKGVASGDISQEVSVAVETRSAPSIYGPKKL